MKNIFYLMLLICITDNLSSQVLFEKSFTNFNNARKLSVTSDGGCIIASRSAYLGNDDMCMTKLDASGNVQWCKAYGNGTNTDFAEAVVQTLDGGYLLAGGSGTVSFYVKTDASGNVQWNKYYTLGTVRYATGIYCLPDTSYIISGGGAQDMSEAGLTKIDKTGNVVFTLNMPSQSYTCCTYYPQIYDVIGLSDGNILAIGSYFSSSSGKGYLMKINPTGSIIWRKTYLQPIRFYSGIEASNSDIILVGRGNSTTYGTVTRLDAAGSVIWSKQYQQSATSSYWPCPKSVVETSSGDLLVLARSADGKVLLFKLSNLGLIQNTVSFPNLFNAAISEETAMSLKPTPDGAWIFAFDNKVKKVNANITSLCGKSNESYISLAITTSMTNVSPSSNSSNTPSSNTFINGSVPCTATLLCSTTALSASSAQINPSCNGQCTGSATVTPSGGLTPYTYVWTPGGQTTDNITGLCAGSYTCTVTDAGNSTVSVVVTISQPAVLSLSETHTNILCSGQCTGAVNLTATGGTSPYSYGGQTTNLCAGTYTFTTTDSKGCADTITAVITQPGPIIANASASPGSYCIGGCTNLGISASGGSPGYTYLWLPGNITGQNPNVCPTVNTTYTCTVTDANSCTQTSTVTVTVNSIPAVSVSAQNTTACADWTANPLTGTPSGGTFTGIGVTGNNFDPSVAGQGNFYAVYYYTDGNGCSNSDSVLITVNLCTVISEHNAINVSVYPNPFSSSVILKGMEEPMEIAVFDALGETVLTRIFTKQIEIDTKDLPAGIYFFCVKNRFGTYTKKVVKE